MSVRTLSVWKPTNFTRFVYKLRRTESEVSERAYGCVCMAQENEKRKRWNEIK